VVFRNHLFAMAVLLRGGFLSPRGAHAMGSLAEAAGSCSFAGDFVLMASDNTYTARGVAMGDQSNRTGHADPSLTGGLRVYTLWAVASMGAIVVTPLMTDGSITDFARKPRFASRNRDPRQAWYRQDQAFSWSRVAGVFGTRVNRL